MTSYHTRTYPCAVCGRTGSFSALMSTNSSGSDLDGRPRGMARLTLESWIQCCASCGYCARDISAASDSARALVPTRAYRALLRRGRKPSSIEEPLTEPSPVPPLAAAFMAAAYLAEHEGQWCQAGQLHLEGAWACDGDAPREARQQRSEAVANLSRAWLRAEATASDAAAHWLRVADLHRRAGNWEAAREAALWGLAVKPPSRLDGALLFELGLCEAQDDTCRGASDAEAWAKERSDQLPELRAAALAEAAVLPPAPSPPLELLLSSLPALFDPTESVRQNARMVLSLHGTSELVPALLSAVVAYPSSSRDLAQVLAVVGNVEATLVAWIDDADFRRRYTALMVFSERGSLGAAPALFRRAADKNLSANERSWLLAALGAIKDEALIEQARPLLASPHEHERLFAVAALKGIEHPTTWSLLAAALRDPSPLVWQAARPTFNDYLRTKNFTPELKAEVCAALRALLDPADPKLNEQLSMIVWVGGNQELAPLLEHAEERLRVAVCFATSGSMPDRAPVDWLLLRAARDASAVVRAAALKKMSALYTVIPVEVPLAALEDPDARVRAGALEALYHARDPRILPRLEALIRDGAALKDILPCMGNKAGALPMLLAAAHSTDEGCACAAVRGLARQLETAPEGEERRLDAVPALIEGARRDDEVGRLALEALRRQTYLIPNGALREQVRSVIGH